MPVPEGPVACMFCAGAATPEQLALARKEAENLVKQKEVAQMQAAKLAYQASPTFHGPAAAGIKWLFVCGTGHAPKKKPGGGRQAAGAAGSGLAMRDLLLTGHRARARCMSAPYCLVVRTSVISSVFAC